MDKLPYLLFGLSCILAGSLPAQVEHVITNAAALFALSDDEVANNREFKLSGKLIYYREPEFILDDGTGRIPVNSKGLPVRLALGDLVKDLSGTSRLEKTGRRIFETSSCKTIVKEHVSQPVDVSLTDLDRPAFAFAFVRVRGRVQEVFTDEIEPRCLYLTLVPETTSNRSFVLCTTSSDCIGEIHEGAVIQISGLYIPWVTSLRRYGGPTLSFRKENLKVVSLPDLAQDAPDFTSQAFVSPDKILALGKRRLDGSVLASWGGNQLLMRSGNGKVHRIELSIGQPLPRCGERVSVIGDAETDLYHLNLSHGICRTQEARHDDATQAIAKPVVPEAILDNEKGERKIQPGYSGQLIKIRGRATLPQSIICDTSHIYLNCGRHIVPVDISSLGKAYPDVPPDTLVEATGICLLDIANWRPNSAFPKIQGFTVIARSQDDIRIVAKPPWWTQTRLAAVIVILLVVLAASLVWNRSLKFMVDRRSRQLLREQISHVTTILKTDERTWLAVELHDTLSQNLAGVACQIEAMHYALSTEPDTIPERLATAKRMLLSCRTELKRCLFDLRCHALEELSFDEAIRTTLRPILGHATLSVHFNVPRQHFLDTSAHTILCIIRELVSNAIRHGTATQIAVDGDLTDETLRFSVRDNGTGFDPKNVAGPLDGHFGLQGIRDRLDRLGGEMKIESTYGTGTTASMTIRAKGLQASN